MASDTHREEPEHRAALLALYAGKCWRCRRRFPKGAEVFNEGKHKLAHADCVENDIQPPPPPPPAEDMLEEARHALKEIAKISRPSELIGKDVDQLAGEVYERASGTLLSINEQKARRRG